MTTLLTWLTISAVVGFLAWLIAALRQSGRDEAEAEEAVRERELARKQAEVLAQMRSASDAADDRDKGRL